MKNLKNLIDTLSVSEVSAICGVSIRAVYKWRTSNALPRTDYTGETNYSERLAKALNYSVTADEIKRFSNPANFS
ncbi:MULTISPECIES: helix-turn-helix domain-containing protein [Gallibacterium]|uniref:Helix-turn-helix domain-containing protein n=1 Tax=Gallibacterium anatis TaxID=750 RepID=A0AAX3XCZ2_9PAST|nr:MULTISPECIES: helix-turn-helix domain-containing protein [Gallibacterium]MDK9430957.1 helix-turn-helix domain-containing protein [Gallibacterium anatis]OBX02224.1 regulatory protein [Gallibacterium genomosp. 1]WIM80069.1 helix-turn-helix domain-containing protein [Gallibacterium anatis]